MGQPIFANMGVAGMRGLTLELSLVELIPTMIMGAHVPAGHNAAVQLSQTVKFGVLVAGVPTTWETVGPHSVVKMVKIGYY